MPKVEQESVSMFWLFLKHHCIARNQFFVVHVVVLKERVLEAKRSA